MATRAKRTAKLKSTVENLQKQRLIYVRIFYFPHLVNAELHRRLSGHGKPDLLPPAELMAHGEERWPGSERSLGFYFELDGQAPSLEFIRKACRIFARDWIHRKRSPAKIDDIAAALENYVVNGVDGPYAALRGDSFADLELAFEHELSLPVEEPKKLSGPFSQLGDMLHQEPLNAAARTFLRGGGPDDWSVVRQVAVPRFAENKILSALLNDGVRLVTLTGAAGDGKTTILKRVAMTLRRQGWRVFFCVARRRPFPNLPRFEPSEHRTCILIDDADQAANFDRLEDDLARNPQVAVVLAARAYNWVRKRWNFRNAFPVGVERLHPSEFDSLASAIFKHAAADAGVPIEEIKKRISDSVRGQHPHLLAAMISATKGKAFKAVITDMISEFEKEGDAWILRAIAVGIMVSELGRGRISRLPYGLLRAVISAQLKQTAPSIPEGEHIRRKLREWQSELTLRRIGYFQITSECDLRHPDIADIVLEQAYGCRWHEGVIERAELFASDLSELASIEVNGQFSKKDPPNERWRPYLARAAAQMMFGDSPPDFLWVGHQVISSLIELLGHYPEDRAVKRWLYTILGRALMAHETPNEMDDQGRRPADLAFEQALDLSDAMTLSDTWLRWIDAAVRWREEPARLELQNIIHAGERTEDDDIDMDHDDEVDDDDDDDVEQTPDEYSDDGPEETAVTFDNDDDDSRSFDDDVEDEDEVDDDWENDDRPERSSLARLAEQAAYERQRRHAEWANRMLTLYDLPGESPGAALPYFPRWLCRRAWQAGVHSNMRFKSWIDTEEALDHFGLPTDPDLYSVRWIYQNVPLSLATSTDHLFRWAKFEATHGNLGDRISPAPSSARGIIRRHLDLVLKETDFLESWLQLEVRDENIGEFAEPAEGSARWICREAWNRGNRSLGLRKMWLVAEEASETSFTADIAKPVTFSSRWIHRQRWKDSVGFLPLLLLWIRYERGVGNLGACQNPADYSARWICRTAWLIRSQGKMQKPEQCQAFLAEWLATELVDWPKDDASLEPNSPRWICRQAWQAGLRTPVFWRSWLTLEEASSNHGDPNGADQFSASWIRREGKKHGLVTSPLRPLSLSTAPERANRSNETAVRQKFSHGRTRAVTVEVKKPYRRTTTEPPLRLTETVRPTSPLRLRTLTAEEKEARERARSRLATKRGPAENDPEC